MTELINQSVNKLLKPAGCSPTSSDMLGPYYFHNPNISNELIFPDNLKPYQAIEISGQVTDCNGLAIPNTLIDIWQTDQNGCYSQITANNCSQVVTQDPYFLRGSFFTNSEGYYNFDTLLPGHYGSRPAHIHLSAKKLPLQEGWLDDSWVEPSDNTALITQIYFQGDDVLNNEAMDLISLMDCNDEDANYSNDAEGNSELFNNCADITAIFDITLDVGFIESSIFCAATGDMNYDHSVTILDIVSIVNYILDAAPTSVARVNALYAADMDMDQEITVIDVIQVVNNILDGVPNDCLDIS